MSNINFLLLDISFKVSRLSALLMTSYDFLFACFSFKKASLLFNSSYYSWEIFVLHETDLLSHLSNTPTNLCMAL